MEKLQQVQKYQFWVLLFVALALPFAGWFMSRSGLMAEAADRTKLLQNLSTSLKVSPEDPNADWQRQLAVINDEQGKQALIAWRTLFDRQKPFMVWPKDMVEDPAKIEPFHQEIYRERYVDELEKVHQIVKPADEKWQTGLVKFPDDLLPSPHEEWKLQAPSSKQIEAAQEDLWLLTALLNCIASVNEGASTPFDAPIREIVEIHLRGGTKGAGGGSSPPPSGQPAGGPPGMPGMKGGMPLGIRAGAGNVGANDQGSQGIADPKINGDEVLGPERPAADAKPADKPAGQAPAPAGPAGAAGPAGGGMLKGAVPPGGGLPGAAGGDGGRRGGGSTNMDRYRDNQKEFNTRGFSLQVVMDLRHVPDLLVALSNCEGWPVNILRVHEADYKDEDLATLDSGAGAGEGVPRPMPAAAGNAGFGRPPGGGAPPRAVPRALEEGDDGPANTRSALDDPNLARVAIVGLIYIFKAPPEPVATPAAPQPPGAPAAAADADKTGAAAAGETPAGADSAPSAEDDPTPESDAAEKSDSTTEKDESDDQATDLPETKSQPKPLPEDKAESDESKSGESTPGKSKPGESKPGESK